MKAVTAALAECDAEAGGSLHLGSSSVS